MKARELSVLPAAGLLTAVLTMPSMSVDLEIESYSLMKSIPALSICNNPQGFNDGQFEGPSLKVYGHLNGMGSFAEEECDGQLLITVNNNNCLMKVLPTLYGIPSSGPS